MLRSFNPLGLWLVACALALRLIVAPGFMPVASASGFEIRVCGQPGATIHISGKPDAPAPQQGACAFAALGASATIEPPVAFVAIAPPCTGAAYRPLLIRSPHVGVPAPPPPSQGPPAFA
jgi:hypothetical protein